MARIDLNCDLGESFGVFKTGDDEGIMPFISSANVACGYHGGDPSSIRKAIGYAARHNVAVGAHPGYRDLLGFGLYDMDVLPNTLEDQMLYQISAVAGIARTEGTTLHHVKPHGALYMKAARDRATADAIARATAAFDDSLVIYGIGEMLAAGRALNLHVAAEVFAGRIYEPNGWPRTRMKPGGLLTETEDIVRQLVRFARDQVVEASDGSVIDLPAHTVCVHVETAADTALARRIRAGLEAAGVSIGPTYADSP